MRKRSILCGILILLLCLPALALFAAGDKVAEGDLELTEITIQYQPNTLFAVQSVALEKGWFEEAGFEKVNIKNFTSGNLAGEALIAGELSVWVPGNMPVISMRHNGVPIVVTGMLNVCPAEYLMVRNDAGVSKPEDLYGISIGLMVGSTAQGVLWNLANYHGLDNERLQVVNLAPPEQITALRNNEIQALLVWPPAAYKVKDIATYMFDSKDFSHTNVPMVFAESFLKKYPNTAKAIMEVMYRGQDWCADQSNWEEAKAIHAKRSEQPLELVEEMWLDYWNPMQPNGNLDDDYVEDFRGYTEFQKATGRIREPIEDILEYTYTGVLEEIKPEYVMVEGQWTP
jgi:ABC-type nitrate/sulfonate/bicarbonate transport system substrate-binding protein